MNDLTLTEQSTFVVSTGFFKILTSLKDYSGSEMTSKEIARMANCGLCHREIRDNVDAQKIITCARCVHSLLTASRQDRITFRDKLLAQGRKDEARSVEAFIVSENNSEIATFEKTLHFKHFKGYYDHRKTTLDESKMRIRGQNGD